MKKKVHKKIHQTRKAKSQPLSWYFVPFVALVIGSVTLLSVLTTVFAALSSK